jgi:SAM-dependent methyltransferase
MLARRDLPTKYAEWNDRWHAPFGPSWVDESDFAARFAPTVGPRLGPFGFQPNSDTRRFEYPWAFYATTLNEGMQTLEIGGALSGFQFVLGRTGVRVVNVDPFHDYGSTTFYPEAPRDLHAKINKWCGTNVELLVSTLEAATLPAESFDRAYCISTLEHMEPAQIRAAVREVQHVLKPGGIFVLTVDLFLDITPFTEKKRNKWGTNISVREVVDASGMHVIHGRQSELYGFEQFALERVQCEVSDYLVGEYPVMVQTLVLQK